MSWLKDLFTPKEPIVIKVEKVYFNGEEVKSIFKDDKEVWNNNIKQRKTICQQKEQ